MIQLIHEVGCGIMITNIHFMKKRIQLIIIVDALIMRQFIITEKLLLSFITTTSINYQ
jgi:hypothetical protein